MIDYYLKFTDEAEANSVLYTKVPTAFNEEGEATEWSDKANYDNIDIIGTIYNPTGEVETVDEMEVPVMVALDGYHVNIRHNTEASELDAYAVTPTNPRRIWMGD
jgi:hypothetical protein